MSAELWIRQLSGGLIHRQGDNGRNVAVQGGLGCRNNVFSGGHTGFLARFADSDFFFLEGAKVSDIEKPFTDIVNAAHPP